MRIMPRDETERLEQRKAARLALDTSAHASLEYQKILKQCSSPVSSFCWNAEASPVNLYALSCADCLRNHLSCLLAEKTRAKVSQKMLVQNYVKNTEINALTRGFFVYAWKYQEIAG